ncbi:MAG: MBL fold metallo-hydrolase [Deltaproteobacteria bacterium]|nr:MBL fold metallo-hydrolase [Deltaproteobacteria bacterium]
MEIKAFFDARTFTLTYVVSDPETKDALVIDPVMDYEPVGSKIFTDSVDEVTEYLQSEKLTLHWILETHAHADHLSGAQLLKERFPDAKTAMSERIKVVQETFKQILDLPADFPTDGRQFDTLIADGETLQAGSVAVEMIFTPGHTPACGSYRVGDAVFTGDAIFMPDMGTGRCDFPAGSADDLYASISQRLYTLPDETRVFVGHDYQPGGRDLAYESTIGEQKEMNIQLKADTTHGDFIKFRTERDATLAMPKLLFQSIQVNIDAGNLPTPASNEMRYLKIPINIFRPKGALSGKVKDDIKLDTV